jgi:hypothetical protein
MINKQEVIKHGIDCLMAFAIAFLSSVLATDSVTFRIILISLMSAILIGIIKFREFWNAEVMKDCKVIKVSTIFF